jgi:hypothetical protein
MQPTSELGQLFGAVDGENVQRPTTTVALAGLHCP